MRPDANLRAFELLYNVEVGLRELVIELFDEQFGLGWIKQRLAGGAEVKEAIKKGRTYERTTPWIDCVPHHPIYYVDFPVIRQTIEKADNWDNVFKRIFRKKEMVSAALSGLEPIRNAVAHNRKIGPGALATAEGFFTQIDSCVSTSTGSSLSTLAQRCTSAQDLPGRMSSLGILVDRAAAAMLDASPLDRIGDLEDAARGWWMDEDYLGVDPAPIAAFVALAVDYSTLERGRGRGHLIEAWLRRNDVDAVSAAAKASIQLLLG